MCVSQPPCGAHCQDFSFHWIDSVICQLVMCSGNHQEYISREKEWVIIQSESVKDIQSRKCAVWILFYYWTGHCEHISILDCLWISLPLYSGHFKSYQDFSVTDYSETFVSCQGYLWTLLGLVIVYIRFVNAHNKLCIFSGHSVK